MLPVPDEGIFMLFKFGVLIVNGLIIGSLLPEEIVEVLILLLALLFIRLFGFTKMLVPPTDYVASTLSIWKFN